MLGDKRHKLCFHKVCSLSRGQILKPVITIQGCKYSERYVRCNGSTQEKGSILEGVGKNSTDEHIQNPGPFCK